VALTILNKIDITKISQYLSLVDVGKSGLFGKRLDQELPYKIYLERFGPDWKADYEFQQQIQDPSEGLTDGVNYSYALCGSYSLKALFILKNGVNGGNVVINPVTQAIQSPIMITSANFADATHWNGDNNYGIVIQPYYVLQVFADSLNQRFLIQGQQWERTLQGIEITIPGFDATVDDYTFYIYISA